MWFWQAGGEIQNIVIAAANLGRSHIKAKILIFLNSLKLTDEM